VAILIAAFAVFVIGAIVHSQKRQKATGPEGMLGKAAIAKTPLNPTGTVLAEGELWAAIAEEESIKPGEEVIITKVEQLKLSVTRKNIG
ncbi:MAG: NfeD family protein, partial [Chloroflexota bacterium]|nr:NfeD family protein [Chloroflexota bacterium]